MAVDNAKILKYCTDEMLTYLKTKHNKLCCFLLNMGSNEQSGYKS